MTKLKFGYFGLLLWLIPSLLFAWSYTGPVGAARCIRLTNDGGYIVAGTNGLVKLDSTGNAQWQHPWVGAWVEQTPDSGYILATALNRDGELIRTNSVGDTLWTRHYGGTGADEFLSVLPTPDSGFVAAGYYAGPTIGNPTIGGVAWLMKADSAGNQVWSHTFRTGDNRIYAMIRTNDGYLLAGRTNSSGSGNWDFLAIRLDENGDTLWTNAYDNQGGNEMGAAVTSCQDGGFLLTGYTTASGRTEKNLWMVRIDSVGTRLWDRVYHSSGDEYGEAVQETQDGGFIFTGYTSAVTQSQMDLLVMRTDSLGDSLWTLTFATPLYDVGLSVLEKTPGYYIVAGLTNSSSVFFGNGDYWVIGIDSTETTSIKEPRPNSLPGTFRLESIYPNPFNSTTIIRYSLPEKSDVQFSLVNSLGQTVSELLHQTQSAGRYSIPLEATRFPSGVYFVQMRSNDQVRTAKIVLLK